VVGAGGAWTPQLPSCAEAGFHASPGCTTSTTHVELQVKERKGQGEAWRGRRACLAIGAPTRRAREHQMVLSAHKGVKTFVSNKKHDLLVTGGGDRSVQPGFPTCPGEGLWESSPRRAGAELCAEGEQPANHVRVPAAGSSGVFADRELQSTALLHCFGYGHTPQRAALQLIALNTAIPLLAQTPEKNHCRNTNYFQWELGWSCSPSLNLQYYSSFCPNSCPSDEQAFWLCAGSFCITVCHQGSCKPACKPAGYCSERR